MEYMADNLYKLIHILILAVILVAASRENAIAKLSTQSLKPQFSKCKFVTINGADIDSTPPSVWHLISFKCGTHHIIR